MKKTNILAALLLINISLYGANTNENGEDKETAALQELEDAGQTVSHNSASEIINEFFSLAQQRAIALMAGVSDLYERTGNPFQEYRRNRSVDAYNKLDKDPTMQIALNNDHGAIEKK